jgi:hypothetical protein
MALIIKQLFENKVFTEIFGLKMAQVSEQFGNIT